MGEMHESSHESPRKNGHPIGARASGSESEAPVQARPQEPPKHSSRHEPRIISTLLKASMARTHGLAAIVHREFRSLRPRVDSEDLHQEAWIRVLNQGSAFRGSNEPQAMEWFSQVLRRTGQELLRESPLTREYRLARESGVSLESAVSPQPGPWCRQDDGESTLELCTHDRRLTAGSGFPDAGSTLISSNSVVEIRKAIEKLSHQQREVLLLVGFEGLTVEDTATRLQLSATRVSKILWKVRNALRVLLPSELRAVVDSWRSPGTSRDVDESRSPGVPEPTSPGDGAIQEKRNQGLARESSEDTLRLAIPANPVPPRGPDVSAATRFRA
jgi:RNA polymerase sigma factor (sigma-70 family)